MTAVLMGLVLGILALESLIDQLPGPQLPIKQIWPEWIGQAGLLVAVVLLFRAALVRYYRNEVEPPPPRSIEDIHKVSKKQAKELQRTASRFPLTLKQVLVFSMGLLEPAQLRQRVTERYTPGQRALTQEVTAEIRIPNQLLALKEKARNGNHFGVSTILLPVLTAPKGTLHDNLEIYSGDNGLLSTLTYREYLQFVAGILRLFFALAHGFNTDEDNPSFPVALSRKHDVNLLEELALRQIMRRAQADVHGDMENSEEALYSPIALYVARLIEELPVEDDKRVYLSLAANLVRRLSLRYVRVVALPEPPNGRAIVIYRRTLIPELDFSAIEDHDSSGSARGLFPRFTSWMRVLLGTRPVSVTVSLDNAWTCQSYHVRVDAPEGLYLARQAFVASPEYQGLTQPPVMAKGAPTPLHYRFRRRLGQNYGHFYGRFFPQPIVKQRRPKVQFDFFEVPPGSDLRAAVASVACLGLVWVVGFIMSRTSDPGTDAPAFLLVFPGIAASWLGLDAPAHRLFEGTLTARLSLALTAMLSVGASGLFMLNRSGYLCWGLPQHIAVLGVTSGMWAAIVALSLFNTLFLSYRWFRHSLRFKALAGRSVL